VTEGQSNMLGQLILQADNQRDSRLSKENTRIRENTDSRFCRQ